MKETSYLSAVVTVQKADERVLNYVSSLHEALFERFTNYEVILVCNGPLAKLNEEQMATLKIYDHTTVVLQLAHQHSREVAGYVGLEYAKGDFVLEIEEMDDSFAAEVLPLLWSEMEKGFDVVSAVVKEPSSWFSKFFYGLLRRVSVMPAELETERMRLVTRRALNALFQLKQRVKYRKLLYAHTGFKRSTVTEEATWVSPLNTQKSSQLERLNLATDVLISYTNIVMRAAVFLTVFFIGFSIFGGLYAIFIYFYKDVHIEGWTTLMLFVSFSFAGLFLVLSLVIKYLELIIRETQSSPLHVIESVHIVSHNDTHLHV